MKVVTENPDYVIDEEVGIDWSNWDHPENLSISQLSMEKVFRTVALEAGNTPSEIRVSGNPLDVGVLSFRDPREPQNVISGIELLTHYLNNDGLMVVHKGEVIHESYRNAMGPTDRHVIHSCTKSLCAMICAMAMEEGLLHQQEEISSYIPEFAGRAEWNGVTVQHVLDMQAGIKFSEHYDDPQADYWHYARSAGYYPPRHGEELLGVKDWIVKNLITRNYEPGTAFVYNSCLANILGMALENAYGKDLAEIFEEKFYTHIGAESDGYLNTDSHGFPIIEGQFNLRLCDFARCAYPIINQGRTLEGKQLVPSWFIDQISKPDRKARSVYHLVDRDDVFPNGQYRNQFWGLDTDHLQFSMLGIHGQFAWFDLTRELMVVGVGSYPQQDSPELMATLKTFWDGIALAVDERDR